MKLTGSRYSDECDRLATLEAQNNHTSWGRWYLEDGMLCTWLIMPKTEGYPVRKCYVYYIAQEQFKTENQRSTWIDHMKEKNWIGDKGIKDLERAFKYLSKKVGE